MSDDQWRAAPSFCLEEFQQQTLFDVRSEAEREGKIARPAYGFGLLSVQFAQFKIGAASASSSG